MKNHHHHENDVLEKKGSVTSSKQTKSNPHHFLVFLSLWRNNQNKNVTFS
jgi:hypothetical protein